MEQNSLQNHKRSFTLFRDSGYNLLTQSLIIVLSIWAIPILVHGLGNERFGLLALLWSVIGYFSLLDFGISRATTKFLAESLVRNDEIVSLKIVWVSMLVVLVVGIIGMGIFICTTPFLLKSLFKISSSLYGEAVYACYVSALSIPFMLFYGIMKGIQMAYERFDLVNIYQGSMGIIQWFGSIVIIWLGYGLKEVILLTLISRVLISAVSFCSLPKMMPTIFNPANKWDNQICRQLFYFGGWLSVTQIVSPMLVYFDRILIGYFLGLSMVAYYSIPQEAMVRVLVIPTSIAIVLFPVFSKQNAVTVDRNKYSGLYRRSLKYLLVIMLPIVIGMISFAQEILALWVGAEYSSKCTIIFQVFTIGILFASLSQIPMTYLQAIGRADICAKIQLIELPIVILMNVILIPYIGVVGSAITWSFRLTMEYALFLYAKKRLDKNNSNELTIGFNWKKQFIEIIIVLCVLFFISLVHILMIKIIIVVFLLGAYLFWTWSLSFDDGDRQSIINISKGLFV